MSEHPEHDACATVDELVEPYLDGELTTAARSRVERHLARCPACAGELAIARELRATLRALPAQTCPPAVTATVLARARADARRVGPAIAPADGAPGDLSPTGFWQRLWGAPAARWRPAAALVALAVFGLVFFARPARPPAVPPAEVARAEDDVKLALAYLGRIGAQTGAIVRHEVFEERLAPPIAHSLRHALLPVAYLPSTDVATPPAEPGSEL